MLKAIKNNILTEKAINKAEIGLYDESLEILNSVLINNPSHEHALATKANVFNRLHKYEEALELCDQILMSNSKNKLTFFYKAIALTNLKKYKAALENFDKALKIDSKNEEFIKVKGSCVYSMYSDSDMLDNLPNFNYVFWSKINYEDIYNEYLTIYNKKYPEYKKLDKQKAENFKKKLKELNDKKQGNLSIKIAEGLKALSRYSPGIDKKIMADPVLFNEYVYMLEAGELYRVMLAKLEDRLRM